MVSGVSFIVVNEIGLDHCTPLEPQRDCGNSYPSLFFGNLKLLHVDGFLHLLALGHRGLFKSLTSTQFAYCSGFFKLSFEAFQSSFDVLAFFNWNYDHNLLLFFILFLSFFVRNHEIRCAKLEILC